MKARVRMIDGQFYWPMQFATGFADIPSSQGYKTILVGPFETIAEAVQEVRGFAASQPLTTNPL